MSTTSTTSKTRPLALALVALLFASLLAAPATPASADENGMVDVIVRTVDGLSITTSIELMGGTVTGSLNAIDSVTAEVPVSSLASIESIPGVLSVSQDLSVQLSGAGWDQGNKDANTLKDTSTVVNASSAYGNGFDGSGITVALIDSGVSPVPGLAGSGKIINGPDLSLDSQVPALAHLDAYGHGTHMAGIIGANADGATGIAPGASILNVKVGAANGAVDVSQVLAGINWVIEHKNDNGMNVRVLNLSFGTDSAQSYMIDPLSYAVEVAWRNGIVVVVASGNDSNGSALRSPATNPYIIAVGASDTHGTTKLNDDSVPTWSNCGTSRTVDLVAPGVSIASLRVPGSYADINYPGARVGDKLFKGTGSSQSAAVVSGIVALVLDAHPEYTPDQVKAALSNTANAISDTGTCVGAGSVSAKAFLKGNPGEVYQTYPAATGTGSLEAARGSDHLEYEGVVLNGEQDIFGQAFDSSTWTGSTWTGSTWTGGDWNGSTWTGSTWTGSTWTGSTWTGSTWTGSTWTGSTWTDAYWNGSTWTGSTWTGSTWTGSTWTGSNWTGLTWDHGKRIR